MHYKCYLKLFSKFECYNDHYSANIEITLFDFTKYFEHKLLQNENELLSTFQSYIEQKQIIILIWLLFHLQA